MHRIDRRCFVTGALAAGGLVAGLPGIEKMRCGIPLFALMKMRQRRIECNRGGRWALGVRLWVFGRRAYAPD